MEEICPTDDKFLIKLTEIVFANYKNEKFGVSQLAAKMGMNRVALYRKVKSKTNKSASKFICEYRLNRALEMLQRNSGTISDIGLEVGFGSVSYFIKCFHDFFGFPPGEIRRNHIGFNYFGFGKSVIRKVFFWFKVTFIIEIFLFILIVLLFLLHLFEL